MTCIEYGIKHEPSLCETNCILFSLIHFVIHRVFILHTYHFIAKRLMIP